MRSASSIIFGLLAVFALSSVPFVKVSDNVTDAMLAKDVESYNTYQTFLEHFPNDLYATFGLVQESCTQESWEFLIEFESSLSQLETVHRTLALSSDTVKYFSANNDQFYSDSFRDTDFSNAEQRCLAASTFPPTAGSIISDDTSVLSIVVIAKPGITTPEFSRELRSFHTIWSKKAEELGMRLPLTGDPILSSGISSAIESDSTLVVALVLALTLLVFATTRSARVAFAAFVSIAFSISGALASTVWLDMNLTPGSALAIFLLAPLAAAFVLHSSAYTERSEGTQAIPSEAIVPTLFAGMTTALLFGSTGITSSPDVQALAIIGVIGIVFAVISLFLFVFPFIKNADLTHQIKVDIPTWMIVRSEISFALFFILILWVLIGTSLIRFEYKSIDYLPPDNQDRAALEELAPHFGYLTIPLMLDIPDIHDPKIWTTVANLVDALESESNIRADWIYEPLSELYSSLDENASGQFPQTEQELEQLFLLVNTSDYDRLISPSDKQLTVLLNVPFKGSADYYDLKSQVQNYLSDYQISGRLTGRVSGYFETGHEVGVDNLRGLAFASILMFVVLVLIFRSFVLAAIILIVNLLPTLSAISALSIANIPIDLGSSIVTAIAFGIVIDDSTHLVVRIRRLQTSGYDPFTAVVTAIRELAKPIVFTSITLSIGFAVLFFAELRTFHDFSMTILIALGTALIADLMILPAMVRHFARDPLRNSYD